MTATEQRNLERTRHWEWTWNNDVMRMVDECYAENCEVADMLGGRTFHGRAELREVEKQMIAVDASRRMTINHMFASGSQVCAEMDASWDGGTTVIRSCVVLTFDDDGLIAVDHSYSTNPTAEQA